MKKRIISSLLVLCMILGLLPASALAADVSIGASADSVAADAWYKDQLGGMAAALYNALDELSRDEDFTAGTASVDLPEGGYVSQEELAYYVGGNAALVKAFQDARDAFFLDHPEFFYIDSTKLTLRVGTVDGKYAAYINNGANANYLDSHFSSAEALTEARNAVAAAKDSIVAEIRSQKNISGESSTSSGVLSSAEIVTLVHDKLVERFDYKYPSESNQLVTGVYSLVGGDANCQGYSKSLKWILDDLGIPCVLVAGAAENSSKVVESHMWNYVRVDGTWFAVDSTWDDPIVTSRAAENLRHTYLLQGSSVMDANHSPSGIFSPGGKTFVFPELSDASYEVSISSNLNDTDSDLKVYTKKMVDEGIEQTQYLITYLGMSPREIEAAGLHLAARFAYEKNGVLEPFQPWVDMAAYRGAWDGDSKFYTFPISRPGSIQLCITDRSMGAGRLCYTEDLSAEGNHTAITKTLRIPYYSDYVAPPYVRKSEPALTSRILPVKTHYTVEYYEVLTNIDPDAPIGIDVTATSEFTGGLTDDVVGTVENLTMSTGSYTLPDGSTHASSILTFDFIPDKSYQGYTVYYTLTPTNLKGVDSRKTPNEFHISTTFEMRRPCPIWAAQGGDNEAFTLAFPSLITGNSDIFDYKGIDRRASSMDIRLVATIPGQAEADEMVDAIPDADKVESSAVYDLSLGCTQMLAALRPGSGLYNVTIGVPYPPGFNYNKNPNVVFKAYHYEKQPDGTYVAREIPCRIGELGLEVIADSFSPFSVVALDNSEGDIDVSDERFVSVSLKTAGGDVTVSGTDDGGNAVTVSAVGLHALKEGESRTFTVVPQEDYRLDKVFINGVEDNTLPSAYTFSYDKLEQGDVTLAVSFIAESVEEPVNFTAITPKLTPISLDSVAVELEAAPGKVVLSAPEESGVYYYKTSHTSDAASKPSVGDSINEKWARLTTNTEIVSDPGVELFTQVVKVENGGITAWGQASAAATEVLEHLSPVVTAEAGIITLASPTGKGYTYYYRLTQSGGGAPELNSAVTEDWTLLRAGQNKNIPHSSADGDVYVQLIKVADSRIKGWGETRVPARDLATLGTVSPSLTAGNGKVTLAALDADGFTFYYKSGTADDSANKPALNATELSGWTIMDGTKDISAANKTVVFVQVIRVDAQGRIVAWGQASATPKDNTPTPVPPSDSNGSSTAGSNTTAPAVSASKGAVQIAATAKVSGTAAGLEVTEKDVSDAVALLQKDKNLYGGAITLNVTARSATSLSVSLPLSALKLLLNSDVSHFAIESGLCTVSFNSKALQAIKDHADGAVTLKIADLSSGGRPAYEFSAVSGNQTISDFGGGTVTLSLPYQAPAGENTAKLCGVYTDANGAAHVLPLSRYDANAKALKITTNHFSSYAVELLSGDSFTDTVGSWAEESINFTAARGIFSGNGNGAFAPDSNLTRGMFVTVLGRLYGVDTNDYTSGNFSDVAVGSYYAPYIEWAQARGIVSGIGDGQFAPGRAITRQEMALIINKFAKISGAELSAVQDAAPYADAATIAAWAADAVTAMQVSGLMGGKPGNRFDPNGTATRAEAAALLQRYIGQVVA